MIVCWGVSRVKERGGAVEGAKGVFLFLFLFFVCLSCRPVSVYGGLAGT